MKARVCELCNEEAALYCSSDSAFLCRNCDAKVHGANFLVGRHVRRTVCSKCKGFTENRFSGVGNHQLRAICRSCSSSSPGDDLDSWSSSSPLACISSTESYATRPKKVCNNSKSRTIVSSSSGTDVCSNYSKFPGRFSGEVTSGTTRNIGVPSSVDSKTDGLLVNWYSKLGLSSSTLQIASHAVGVCLEKLAVLPFHVCLAASVWFSLRFCVERSVSTWQDLKRLEEVSGVPAKLILTAESKLARVWKTRKSRRRRRRQQQPEEEGWAECSP